MPNLLARGLLFDMDGVLADSTAAVARTWTRWASRYGFDPASTVKRAHGRPSLATLRELLPNASPDVLAAEDAWMERIEIEDVADVIALPGTRELLSALPPDQFAVVTSASRELAIVRLSAAGLWEFVHHLVSSSDIRNGKPHPEPYQKGAAALRLPPSDCIVIEDAPAGIRSGKAAGALAIGVRTTSPELELLSAGADFIINDCSSILLTPSANSPHLALNLLDDSSRPRVPQMY